MTELFEGVHESYEGLSSAVEVCANAKKGRHCVARVDIPAGFQQNENFQEHHEKQQAVSCSSIAALCGCRHTLNATAIVITASNLFPNSFWCATNVMINVRAFAVTSACEQRNEAIIDSFVVRKVLRGCCSTQTLINTIAASKHLYEELRKRLSSETITALPPLPLVMRLITQVPKEDILRAAHGKSFAEKL